MWLNKDFLLKRGIYSICSSNEFVLNTAIEFAKEKNDFLLLEATCHQVNQFGGYTGLTPQKYREFINKLVKKYDFPKSKLILGGDHLGPDPWKHLPSHQAMNYAEELIKSYVDAGFRKIHIDCSMPLGDDPEKLSIFTIAEREARLYEVAEKQAQKSDINLVYVVGTEVPVAGGGERQADVTTLNELEESFKSIQKHFPNSSEALKKIIAFVVRLGISFNDRTIYEYNSYKVKNILEFFRKNNLFIEAHSTDYQTQYSLKKMVEDGIRILKVGPSLTSRFRRAVFLLTLIEEEIIEKNKRSNLINTILHVMKSNPKNWEKYYNIFDKNIDIKLKYSFLDRIRYYWNNPRLKQSLNVLLKNLDNNIPLELLYQFFPLAFELIRLGKLKNDPKEIIKLEIKKELEKYYLASINSANQPNHLTKINNF